MTQEQIKEKIEFQWNKKAHSKIDWLGLEQTIKDIMRLCEDKEIDAGLALATIDEAMGAYLRRGMVFK